MEFSNPKKDLISRLADCSKHVQSEFSGWTCQLRQLLKLCSTFFYTQCLIN